MKLLYLIIGCTRSEYEDIIIPDQPYDTFDVSHPGICPKVCKNGFILDDPIIPNENSPFKKACACTTDEDEFEWWY